MNLFDRKFVSLHFLTMVVFHSHFTSFLKREQVFPPSWWATPAPCSAFCIQMCDKCPERFSHPPSLKNSFYSEVVISSQEIGKRVL